MGRSSTSWPTRRGKTSAPLELATMNAAPIWAVTFDGSIENHFLRRTCLQSPLNPEEAGGKYRCHANSEKGSADKKSLWASFVFSLLSSGGVDCHENRLVMIRKYLSRLLPRGRGQGNRAHWWWMNSTCWQVRWQNWSSISVAKLVGLSATLPSIVKSRV